MREREIRSNLEFKKITNQIYYPVLHFDNHLAYFWHGASAGERKRVCMCAALWYWFDRSNGIKSKHYHQNIHEIYMRCRCCFDDSIYWESKQLRWSVNANGEAWLGLNFCFFSPHFHFEGGMLTASHTCIGPYVKIWAFWETRLFIYDFFFVEVNKWPHKIRLISLNLSMVDVKRGGVGCYFTDRNLINDTDIWTECSENGRSENFIRN